jgi:hypothetical protein
VKEETSGQSAITDLIYYPIQRGVWRPLISYLIFNSSPASYWCFNYLFDIIISVIWFCYLLAIYCIFDAAFNGAPNNNPQSTSIIPVEFAIPWDLRVKFYPLTILIVLPTLPFAYLLTKLFRSDILVSIFFLSFVWICQVIRKIEIQKRKIRKNRNPEKK